MNLYFVLGFFLVAALSLFFFAHEERLDGLHDDVVPDDGDGLGDGSDSPDGDGAAAGDDASGSGDDEVPPDDSDVSLYDAGKKNTSRAGDGHVYLVQVGAKTVIERGADAVVSDLKRGGANTVALQVFSDEDYTGVYWDSKIAPVRQDILDEFILEAHENGLSVFAWMTTLDMVWIYEAHPEMRVKAYMRGKITEDTGWYQRVSPCSPVHREYARSVFREIAENYDVDGILLQDDLYWGSHEVFDELTKDEYFRDTGRVLTSGEIGTSKFHAWKSGKLTSLVKSINDEIKSVDPQVKLAVNVYYDCALDEPWCLSSFGQDYGALLDNSDYMAIMAYHVLSGESPSWVGDVARGALLKEAGGSEVIIKVQAVDWERGRNVDSSDVKDALLAAKRAGARNLGFYLSGRSMREMDLSFERLS